MKNIALTMSDTGFREATFSLASHPYPDHLHYDKKPSLQHERFMDISSGESFTDSSLTSDQVKLKIQTNLRAARLVHNVDDSSKSSFNGIQKTPQVQFSTCYNLLKPKNRLKEAAVLATMLSEPIAEVIWQLPELDPLT